MGLDEDLYSLLTPIKEFPEPATHVRASMTPAPEMPPGSIRMKAPPLSVYITGGRSAWTDFAFRLKDISGIETTQSLPAEYGGPVDVALEIFKHPDEICYYTAPWFIDWLSGSTLTQEMIRQKAIRIADAFKDGHGRLIYRGENRKYKDVRSTLSRRWNTRSQDALASIGRHQVNMLKLGPVGKSSMVEKLSPVEIHTAMRHLGGETNLLDFSLLPWIALYFACEGDDAASDTGRLWSLDVHWPTNGFAVHQVLGKEGGYPVAKERLENQRGVLVEPKTGVLSPPRLKLLASIEPQEKPLFAELLKKIGIEHDTLFSDFVAYIQTHQADTPDDAWMYLMAERLSRGEVNTVLEKAVGRLNSKSGLRDQPGLYYRGLANALLGKLENAREDLKALLDILEDAAPDVLLRNYELITKVGKTYSSKRIMRRLRMELDLKVDVNIATVTLRGYRVVE